jgi:pimeloyl-ACP methyl ester carboxylesterase
MPRPDAALDTETALGTVRCYRWTKAGAESLAPIVLLPGRGSGAPMWSRNLPALARRRTVYALDALGDAGMSEQREPLSGAADQARWLEDCLWALGLERIHLVGHSFGGWLAANYASRYPSRVASLSLLEPVFVLGSIRPALVLKSIPYGIPFLPKAWRQSLIKEISGSSEIDRSDPLARMIDDGTELYAVRLPAPTLVGPSEAGSWRFPAYLALGGRSAVHDSAAIAAAAAPFGGIRVRLWPEGTHSLPMERPEEIGEVSKISGLSVRALQYYDDTGTFRASGRSANGQRYYDEESLLELEHLFFYRQLGLSLGRSKALLLDREGLRGRGVAAALERQELILLSRIERYYTLVAAIGICRDIADAGFQPPWSRPTALVTSLEDPEPS